MRRSSANQPEKHKAKAVQNQTKNPQTKQSRGEGKHISPYLFQSAEVQNHAACFSIAAHCKGEYEPPPMTHTATAVLTEVSGNTQNTEHREHTLVSADSKVLNSFACGLHFLVGS